MMQRNRQGAWQCELMQSKVGGNAALFLLSRSELNFCIRACAEVFDSYRRGLIDLSEARQALWSLRDVSGNWGAAGGCRLKPLEVDGRWIYTSIDASDFTSRPCLDSASCIPKLKRFFQRRYDEAVAERMAAGAFRERSRRPMLRTLAMIGCQRRVLVPTGGGASRIGEMERSDPLRCAGFDWLDRVITLRGGGLS